MARILEIHDRWSGLRVRARAIAPLWILAAAAFLVRAAAIVLLDTEHGAPLTYEHGEIAANLVAGRGFTVRFLGQEGPTSQQAPAYPAMLAALYWLFGVESHAAILTMQFIQAAAGMVLVLAVARLAWTLAPERPLAGWLAGWGAALYPPHVYMTTHIQVATWAALWLVLLMVIVARRDVRPANQAMLAGLAAGVLLLFEPILVLAVPVAACSLAVRTTTHQNLRALRTIHTPLQNAGKLNAETPRRRECSRFASLRLCVSAFNRVCAFNRTFGCVSCSRSAIRASSIFLAVTAMVVAPWIVRNYLVHGELVFIKSTFGYALWQGNNAISRGTDKVPKRDAERLRTAHDGTLADMNRAMWEARHETLYIDDVLLKPSGYVEFAGLSEPERSRHLGRQAVAYVRRQPARYARLCLDRLRFFLLFDETNPKAAHPVYRLASAAWLVLAAAGLAAARKRWPRHASLLAVVVLVTAFHALTITSARFRIPIEPLGLVWCGEAAAAAVSVFSRRVAVARRVPRPTLHNRNVRAA